jgi:hypothetical protein
MSSYLCLEATCVVDLQVCLEMLCGDVIQSHTKPSGCQDVIVDRKQPAKPLVPLCCRPLHKVRIYQGSDERDSATVSLEIVPVPNSGPEMGSTSGDVFRAAKCEGRQCAFTFGGPESCLKPGPDSEPIFRTCENQKQRLGWNSRFRVHARGVRQRIPRTARIGMSPRTAPLSPNVAVWQGGQNAKKGSTILHRSQSSLATSNIEFVCA